ncbi:MAG: class I SAM-dependent methyltransferase [Cocleimonas sp.]|nr:class I SAM-dependent methyltransferase [Cocleimonas sp.]
MSVAYKKAVWDEYSTAFLAVMPSKMLTLNKAVAAIATGNVGDFGCGAAKIAPFILNNPNVEQYTGIDSSPEMVKLARWHLEQFPDKPSKIIESKLECLDTGIYDFETFDRTEAKHKNIGFDYGLSINSYYAWESPKTILDCIYNALKPQASFILVTPNHQLDMVALLDEAERELVANPYFESFKAQNIDIENNKKAVRIDMDELIDQARNTGFKVIEAHQRFYDQGLNYLHLKA